MKKGEREADREKAVQGGACLMGAASALPRAGTGCCFMGCDYMFV